jgi:hypothetical protein
MQVMHGKGLLLRDESERSHVYAAAHAKDALQTNLLGELVVFFLDTGVVEGAVQAAVACQRLAHQRLDLRRLRDVGAMEEGLAAGAFDLQLHASAGLGIDVGEHDPGAGRGESNRSGAADPAGGAGDERHAPGKRKMGHAFRLAGNLPG